MTAGDNAVVSKRAVWGGGDSGTPVLGMCLRTESVKMSPSFLTGYKDRPKTDMGDDVVWAYL